MEALASSIVPLPVSPRSHSESNSVDSEASDSELHPSCNCKTTCQRKSKCPCKGAGVLCTNSCQCGTKRKPCKNKPSEIPAAQTIAISNRETRVAELQEFVSTLTTDECHKLILEAYCQPGGIRLARALVHCDGTGDDMPSDPPNNGNSLSWCICGRCRNMEHPNENVCCRKSPCITTIDSFEMLVLQRDVLSVAIVHRSDTFGDDPEYTLRSYRKAAYRQWSLWQHGYLGRGNRRVIPSCVVWAVREKYPDPDGQYLGFREY